MAARTMTVLLMVFAGVIALYFLQNAGQAFKFLLLSGAGTGAIYLLRWFWYRINAWTEIAGMVAASIVAIWIIAGPGNEGTKRWIVDYKSVRNFVQVVDQPDVASAIEKQQAEAQPVIDALAREVEALRGDDAQDRLYREKFHALAELTAGNTTLALFKARSPEALARAEEQLKATDEDSVAVALVKKGKVYIYDARVDNLVFPVQLLICVGFVTLAWLLTALLTSPSDISTLRGFYKLCHPGGPGWKKVVLDARADGEEIDQKEGITDWKLPIQLLCVFLGCVAIYSSLFAIGNFIYGNMVGGALMSVLAAGAMVVLFRSFGKLGAE